jgi:hypothetical protein
MALDRSIYKRLPDLYKTGKTVTLPDGQPMWLQVLNPFERDEAVRDASVARTRLKLSIENHPESDEAVTLELVVSDMTREDMIDEMVTGKKVNAFLEVYDEMRAEDEWREKWALIDRKEEIATSPSAAEVATLDEVDKEIAFALNKRLDQRVEYDKAVFADMTDEEVIDKYKEFWTDNRAAMVGMAEFRLTEMWYACRVCVGAPVGDDWDHSMCEGHTTRVFEEKKEVRHMPEHFQTMVVQELETLDMTEREAKN